MATSFDNLAAKIADKKATLATLSAQMETARTSGNTQQYYDLMGQGQLLQSSIWGMESRLAGPVGNTSIHNPRRSK